jgi:hypothetical protein
MIAVRRGGWLGKADVRRNLQKGPHKTLSTAGRYTSRVLLVASLLARARALLKRTSVHCPFKRLQSCRLQFFTTLLLSIVVTARLIYTSILGLPCVRVFDA